MFAEDELLYRLLGGDELLFLHTRGSVLVSVEAGDAHRISRSTGKRYDLLKQKLRTLSAIGTLLWTLNFADRGADREVAVLVEIEAGQVGVRSCKCRVCSVHGRL